MDYIERLIHNLRLEVEEVICEDRVDDLTLVKYHLQKAEEHYKKTKGHSRDKGWCIPPSL